MLRRCFAIGTDSVVDVVAVAAIVKSFLFEPFFFSTLDFFLLDERMTDPHEDPTRESNNNFEQYVFLAKRNEALIVLQIPFKASLWKLLAYIKVRPNSVVGHSIPKCGERERVREIQTIQFGSAKTNKKCWGKNPPKKNKLYSKINFFKIGWTHHGLCAFWMPRRKNWKRKQMIHLVHFVHFIII